MANVTRRNLGLLLGGAAAAAAVTPLVNPVSEAKAVGYFKPGGARYIHRFTGVDKDPAWRFKVGGTDLGIPYLLPNGSVSFVFGDTYTSVEPNPHADWRSPVILRSNYHPSQEIRFDNAAGVGGNNRAPQVIRGIDRNRDNTLIPNDAITLPGNRQLISYWSMMSVGGMKSRFSGLALSTDNGNYFDRHRYTETTDRRFQWVSMEYNKADGHVYMISTNSERENGPTSGLFLRRVHHSRILDMRAYQGWYWNGSRWGWGNGGQVTSLFPWARYGELSLRRLDRGNGRWVMSYFDYTDRYNIKLVTRHTDNIMGLWSNPKVQAEWAGTYYGGFIHPYSTEARDDLYLIVSQWIGGKGVYHCEQWRASVL